MGDWLCEALARYACTDWGTIEPAAIHEAQRRVIDTVGIGVGALHEPGPRAARRYAERVAGPGGATIWGSSVRATEETAALVNGVAMRTLDFSDAYFGADSTHPSDLVPGMLALAETTGRSGHDVLEALVVGYEVSVACADGLGIRRNGWDHTNVTMIGACCGFGRLLGLDARQMEQALAMTVVPHAVMRQTCFGGGPLTMWKGYGAPDAMRQAVYACLLAEAGVTGPPEPFTGGAGFLHLMLGGDLADRSAFRPLEDLVAPRRILDTHIKAWPVGYVGQGAAEAALRIHPSISSVDDIDTVEIETFQMAIDLMGSGDKWRPMTRESADHSIPYLVGMALRDGRLDADSFGEVQVRDPDMHRFLEQRVTLSEDPALTAEYPRAYPARVTVRTSSGDAFCETVFEPKGHAGNPMTDEEVNRKFLDLTEPRLGGGDARALLDVLEQFPTLTRVDSIGALLAS